MNAKELGRMPVTEGGNDQWGDPIRGITLRQHFAGLAMQAIMSGGGHGNPDYARDAYLSIKAADALLAELAKEQP